MRKKHAQILLLTSTVSFFAFMYVIWLIFDITHKINSEPNPPSWWTLFTIPYCGQVYCNITHTLAWNIVAVLMSVSFATGLIGMLKLNFITRRQV